MSFLYPEGRLIVFTKAPEPGKVKTRMIASIGAEGAARLHQELLEDKLELVTASKVAPVELYCSPDMNHEYFQKLPGYSDLTLHTQIGCDLGQRMANAMQETLSKHEMAIVIGTDCPTLDKQYLIDAFNALSDMKDAAIGPADDGGYVLLGLRNFNCRIFEDIEWGSEHVYKQTMSRLKQLNLSVSKLPSLWDIDRPDDLEKYRKYLGNM